MEKQEETGHVNPAEKLWRLFVESPQALDQFYEEHREAFVQFAGRYNLPLEDVLDAYQDAVIAMFEQVAQRRLTQLTSAVRTYLFAIGKNKLVDKLRLKGKEMPLNDEAFQLLDNNSEAERKIELQHRQQLIKEALDQLGDPCKRLLLLFYYQRYSIEAICQAMGYNSNNVVKANKSRCMKKLRTLIQNLYE